MRKTKHQKDFLLHRFTVMPTTKEPTRNTATGRGVYLGPNQTSMMFCQTSMIAFTKLVNGFSSLVIFSEKLHHRFLIGS